VVIRTSENDAPALWRDLARAAAADPEVAQTMRQFNSVTKAVVGVGLWAPGESTVYDATDRGVREELARRGVGAEVAGVLVGPAGHPIESDPLPRRPGPGSEQLRAIPDVIAVAYNTVRSRAVAAAIRGGLVDSLVTHASLATSLLGNAEADTPADVAFRRPP
jgi:DNA-binding transcriptional regulator LsrR (DeoR family)